MGKGLIWILFLLRFLLSVAILCEFAVALPLQAQPQYQFRAFSRPDGLPSVAIMQVVQDQSGFIWLGTSNGLYRFDGQDFLQFRYDPEDEHSISANFINHLYLDQRQNLWVSTTNGLCRLNTKSGQLNRVPLDFPRSGDAPLSIGAVLEDRRRHLWIGVENHGLVRLDPGPDSNYLTPRFYAANPQDSSSIADSFVTALFEDTDGHIWAVFRNAVDRIDPQNGDIRHFRHPLLGNDPGTNRIRHAIRDGSGKILMSFLHSGIFQIHTAEPRPQISPYLSTELLTSFPQEVQFNKIALDKTGQLWVSTTTHGVLLIDPARTDYQLLQPEPRIPGSLSSTDIRSVYEGRTGNIWIGTGKGDLNRGQRVSDLFRPLLLPTEDIPAPDQVYTITGDAEGFIWFGYLQDGIARFRFNERRQQLEKVQHFRHEPGDKRGLTGNQIISLLPDSHGYLWVGTNGNGLNKLDPETGTITVYRHDPQDSSTIAGDRIWAICEDHNGYIWMGGYKSGLSRLDPQTGTVRRFLQDEGRANTPASNTINALMTDSRGHIWIGTNSGLDLFSPSEERFTHFMHQADQEHSLSNNMIFGIHEDTAGQIWVGTSLGLNRLSRVAGENSDRTFRVDRFYEKNGLPGNNISHIQSDRTGNIWVGTGNGLAAMHTVRPDSTFTPMNNEGGPAGAAFWPAAHYQHPQSGWLFFGTADGLLSFHPDYLQERENEYASGLLLSAVTRFQREGPALKTVTDHFIQEKRSLHLGPQDQVILFNLSDLNWSEGRRYEYQFAGFNDQWIPTRDKMEITLNNLRPGDYTLLVRTRNWNNFPTDELRLLDIRVSPPWWKSKWAISSYLLITFALLYLIRRYELHRRELKQLAEVERARAEEKHKQAERIERQAARLKQSLSELRQKNQEILIAQNQLIQQEKLASLGQLTAGIAHEIKNPLNFINNFAEGSTELLAELQKMLGDTYAHLSEKNLRQLNFLLGELMQNSTDIKENGDRVDRIIRSMMQHARGSSDERRLTDLNPLIEDNLNLAYHGYRALDPGFSCSVEKDLDPMIGSIDVFPQALGRVLLNLLNNACYAVGEKQKTRQRDYFGHIFVSTSLVRHPGGSAKYFIRIRDNGIGIPTAVQEKIFEPFFTTKPTGTGNTGLGLSISYDIIVKQHQGQLQVESEEGEFTEFTIQLSDQ